MTEFGPIQLVVLGFEGNNFTGRIVDELIRLKEAGTVRVLDAVFVAKDADGTVTAIEANQLDLGEAKELGAKVGALIGLGAGGIEGAEAGAEMGAEELGGGLLSPSEEDVADIADSIPPNTAAAVLVLEHEWMIGLRDAVIAAGGRTLADAWVRPTDLVALGGALG